MLLFHPISNFLTLFANTLQNPQEPQAESDLILLDKVISLVSDPAFHVNDSTANTAKLFKKLVDVARKLVEWVNLNAQKPTKRTRDEYDPRQDNASDVSGRDIQVFGVPSDTGSFNQQICPPMVSSILSRLSSNKLSDIVHQLTATLYFKCLAHDCERYERRGKPNSFVI